MKTETISETNSHPGPKGFQRKVRNMKTHITKFQAQALVHGADNLRTRYAFDAIQLRGSDAVATDGKMLVRVPLDDDRSEEGETLVSMFDLRNAAGRMSSRKANPSWMEITSNGGLEIGINAGGAQGTVQAIEGSYPDVSRLLEKDYSGSELDYNFRVDVLLKALKAAERLAACSDRGCVKFHFVDGETAVRIDVTDETGADLGTVLVMPCAK